MGSSKSKEKKVNSSPAPTSKERTTPYNIPALPDFFSPFSDDVVVHILQNCNRSALRQLSRCRTNRLALASLLEISKRDAVSDVCAHRAGTFKNFVVGDSLARVFTSGTMELVLERSLHKMSGSFKTNSSGTSTSTSTSNTSNTNYFVGLSEDVAEYLTTLNTLSKSMHQEQVPDGAAALAYERAVALAGYAYGRLVCITGEKSALLVEEHGAHCHQAAHVAALQAVDVATGNWSTFLSQSCPLESRNREAEAVLEYLEHRRLECATQLDAAVSNASIEWNKLEQTSKEEQRKHDVCILNSPTTSVWYPVGYVIVHDIWQMLYVHLENLLTVGTAKYQTLNDGTIWKIQRTSIKNAIKDTTFRAQCTKPQMGGATGITVEQETNGLKPLMAAEAKGKEEAEVQVEVQVEVEAVTPNKTPNSPKSRQRLQQLSSLNTHVEDISCQIQAISRAVDYERTAFTMYAEHDALLQRPDVSFIPARKEISALRLVNWTDALAQMYGDLERLQCTKVDAIITADLNSGRNEAKEMRKKLTKGISSLLDGVVVLRKTVDLERSNTVR